MLDELINLAVSCAIALALFISTVLLVGHLHRRAEKDADEMNEEFRRLSEKTGRVYPGIYVD